MNDTDENWRTLTMFHSGVASSDYCRTMSPTDERSALRLCMPTRRSFLIGAATALMTVLAGALAYPDAARATSLSATRDEYASLMEQIDEASARYQELASKSAETLAAIDEQQALADECAGRMSERIRSGYKENPPLTWLDVLAESDSVDEFVRNMYYVDRENAEDAEAYDEIVAAREELERLNAEYEGQMSDAKQVQDDLAAQVDSLSDDVMSQLASDSPELYDAVAESRMTVADVLDGTPLADSVVSAAYSTPSAGVGLCAAWVTNVFSNAGVGYFTGNACDHYWRWCDSADRSQLATGMIIAVPSEPYSYAAQIYGHIGIYVGNGIVRHSASGRMVEQSVDSWIAEYGVTTQPRWGWLGDVVLI